MNERAPAGPIARALAYAPAILFFVAATALLAVSWNVYPSFGTPKRPGPIQISVATKEPVDSVSLTVAQVANDFGRYAFEVVAWTPREVAPGPNPSVYLAIPGWAYPGSRLQPDCSSPCSWANEAMLGSTFMRLRFEAKPEWQMNAGEPGRHLRVRITVPKAILLVSDTGGAASLRIPGMACGEVQCRGSVPVISVPPGTRLVDGASALVSLDEPSLRDYEWDSPATPYPDTLRGLKFSYPLTEAPRTRFIDQLPVDGTNVEKERRSQMATFIAGVIVSTSLALFLASLQELFSALRSHLEYRRGEV